MDAEILHFNIGVANLWSIHVRLLNYVRLTGYFCRRHWQFGDWVCIICWSSCWIGACSILFWISKNVKFCSYLSSKQRCRCGSLHICLGEENMVLPPVLMVLYTIACIYFDAGSHWHGRSSINSAWFIFMISGKVIYFCLQTFWYFWKLQPLFPWQIVNH